MKKLLSPQEWLTENQGGYMNSPFTAMQAYSDYVNAQLAEQLREAKEMPVLFAEWILTNAEPRPSNKFWDYLSPADTIERKTTAELYQLFLNTKQKL